MNPYDLANELARALKDSEQYKDYHRLRDAAMENDRNRQMINEYKKQQMKMQGEMLAGGQPNRETMEQLQRMTLVLQYNQEISAYLMAEYRLNQLVGDIYKILGDAVELDMSFMQGLQES